MYNTGRKTSLKVVLEKVLRDFEGVITEIQWADAVEWSAEAINLMGLYPSYEEKVSKEITIANFRGELPCDISFIKMGTGTYTLTNNNNDFVVGGLIVRNGKILICDKNRKLRVKVLSFYFNCLKMINYESALILLFKNYA